MEGILGRRGNINIVMRKKSPMCAGLAVSDMIGKQGRNRERHESAAASCYRPCVPC